MGRCRHSKFAEGLNFEPVLGPESSLPFSRMCRLLPSAQGGPHKRRGNGKGEQVDDIITASGPLIRWTGEKASWYFVTLTGDVVGEIHYAALGRTRGFGSVRVRATVGGTSWETSLFPHKESGGFVLPVKAAVRKAEALAEGDEVKLTLAI